VTLRRLEDVLGARDTARDAITFTAPPEAANVFLMALEAARLHLEAEKQARQSTTDALLWMLDHVIAAWIEQERVPDYADFNRDSLLPYRAARRDGLQSHHIVHRSAGGPTSVESHHALRIPSPAGHPRRQHALQRARAGGAHLRAGPACHRAAAAAGPHGRRAAHGVRPLAVVVVPMRICREPTRAA
jgi:hypothetical protein